MTSTFQQVRNDFDYDKITGVFTRISTGKQLTNNIRVDGLQHRVYEVIWMYMTGHWCPQWIDHKDGNNKNNAWDNLREATPTQNAANMRGQGRTPKGVYKHKGRRSPVWYVQLCVKGERIYRSGFKSEAEAITVHTALCEEHQGEFALHNSRKGEDE